MRHDLTAAELREAVRRHRYWEAIPFPATAVGTGVNAPSWDPTAVGWSFSHNPPNNQEVQAVGHAPFHWAIASDFHVALHWYLTVAGAAGEDVKWDLLYRGVNPGGTWPVGWTTLQMTVDVSGYGIGDDIETHWPIISGAGLQHSVMMDFRVQRDTADAADDHHSPVIFKILEAHYQRDSLGGWQEDSKWG